MNANDRHVQLHALHWAFFSAVMDMKFPNLYEMFESWCERLSNEEMDDVMAITSPSDLGYERRAAEQPEDADGAPAAYTEEEIWKSLSEN